jgi:hypothetical protein
VANPTGRMLNIRPPKNVDLTLISMLPITTLVVHSTTAAAIRQKVGPAATGARGAYTQRLEVILPGFPPSPSPLGQTGRDAIPRADGKGEIRIREAADLISMIDMVLQPAGASDPALIGVTYVNPPQGITKIKQWRPAA